MRVGIVGGGAIGLSAAWFLVRAGADVTVIEKDECGAGASEGNAGWVTPALSAPLPAPGLTSQVLRWMAHSDSPLLIRPRRSLDFTRWCWAFRRSCSSTRYHAGIRALLDLNERTLDHFDEFENAGVRFEMYRSGLLFAGLTQRELTECDETLSVLREAGYTGELRRLDQSQVHTQEPALSDAVVGGTYALGERHVRPETLMKGLRSDLQKRGVSILERTTMTGLRADGSHGWIVESPTESLPFDKVLLATGAWTGLVLKRLGTRLLIEGAKGYSMTSPANGGMPKSPLYFIGAKVGCSPYADSLRLAGSLDLTGLDRSLNAKRVGTLVRAASRYLADWESFSGGREWAGLRPVAPDGLPYIGAVGAHPGLYVATGHAMLGITLAPATGALLAPAILETEQSSPLQAFRPDRRM